MDSDTSSEFVEETPVLSLAVDGAAGIETNMGIPLFPVAASDTLSVTFNRAAYVQQHTKGLLLLSLHNDTTTRSQVLLVDSDPFYHLYLPGIGKD
jgi:hypothetical protein